MKYVNSRDVSIKTISEIIVIINETYKIEIHKIKLRQS